MIIITAPPGLVRCAHLRRGMRRVVSRLIMQTLQKNAPTKTSVVQCSGAAAKVPGGNMRTNKFLHIKLRASRSLMSRGETRDVLDLPQ